MKSALSKGLMIALVLLIGIIIGNAIPNQAPEKKSDWSIYEIGDLQKQRVESKRSYLPFLNVTALRCGLYELPAGSDDPQEPHRLDEVYYVLNGKAKIEFADGVENIRPGSVIYVGANVDHRFTDIEEDLSALVFFSSATEE